MRPILATLIVLNGVAFAAYGADKLLSVLKRRRVPEKTLLALMIAGVVGAVGGMLVFRHKTSKSRFRWKSVLPFLAGTALLALGILAMTRLGS